MNFLKAIVPGYAPNGAPILSIIAKASFDIENRARAKFSDSQQIEIYENDVSEKKGGSNSQAIVHESDLIAFKPLTDVVFHGNAHCPPGKKAYYLDVGLQVANRKKIIRAIGNRRAIALPTGIKFSDPIAFEEMPISYNLAYGGKDLKSEQGMEYSYQKNPLGKGFVVKKNQSSLQDLELPNLENPSQLLTPSNLALEKYENWIKWPEPAGLGYVGKNFYPRYTFSGLAPDEFMENEMMRQESIRNMPEIGTGADSVPPPATPMMNHRFFCGASSGLSMPYLKGNERIALHYLDKNFPQFYFDLPDIQPSCWLDVGEGPENMSMVLQTAEIYKEKNLLSLVWRGSAYYKGPEAMEEFTNFEFGIETAKAGVHSKV